MGWETRQRGSRYYVRKEWQRGRCVSRYVGNGDLAMLAATLDNYDAVRRDLARERAATLQAERQSEELPVVRFCTHVDTLLRQTLEAAGYHRPQRRKWRKKRMLETTTSQELATQTPDALTVPDGQAQATSAASTKRRIALI